MVKVRKHTRGWYQVDIRLTLPDGTRYRERVKAPVQTRKAAQRWGEAREREIFLRPATEPDAKREEVPTLAAFAPRFLGWARAERQKPSSIEAKERILEGHLVPLLGERSLDSISNADVAALKTRLQDRAPKSCNNALTVLSKLLKVAVDLGAVKAAPACAVKLLKVATREAEFFDFAEFEVLVGAARGLHSQMLVAVLLGGEAGLRAGEMLALEWTDIDLARGLLRVERGDWRGHVNSTKGSRWRPVPTTARLLEALNVHRHLRGPRVLCQEDGRPLSIMQLRWIVDRACRRANLRPGLHVLRHSFCAHLAMRGAAPGAIQALAGHRSASTTQRYMHLSPRAIQDTIPLLETPETAPVRGNGVATPKPRLRKVK